MDGNVGFHCIIRTQGIEEKEVLSSHDKNGESYKTINGAGKGSSAGHGRFASSAGNCGEEDGSK